MYVADERFKRNIDRHGDGTALFISKAIEIYCGRWIMSTARQKEQA